MGLWSNLMPRCRSTLAGPLRRSSTLRSSSRRQGCACTRLGTIYRACKRAGRILVIDLYSATVAAATARKTVPQPGFPRLRVYVPNRQRILVKESAEFERIEAIRPHRIFLEEIGADPDRF